MIDHRAFNEAGERALSALGISLAEGEDPNPPDYEEGDYNSIDILRDFEQKNDIKEGMLTEAALHQLEMGNQRIAHGEDPRTVAYTLYVMGLLTGWFLRDKKPDVEEFSIEDKDAWHDHD